MWYNIWLFWKNVFIRIMENVLSIKIQILIATIGLITYLLIYGYLTSDDFTTIFISILTIVIGARSLIKFGYLTKYKEQAKEIVEKITDVVDNKPE